MTAIPKAMRVIRACKYLLIKFLLAVFIMSNFGCSYENIHADSSINIEFEQESSVELFNAVKEFANKNNLKIQDESKEFPSGLNSILYELRNEGGLRLFKVTDLMDKRRFVISVYEIDEKGVQSLFESMFVFLKGSFPNANVEVKGSNS